MVFMAKTRKKLELYLTFDVNITGKCNFACKFCTQEGRGLPNKHMALREFKSLILEIKALSRRENKKFRVCVAGGEPFINPNAVEMLAFAVKQLGAERVEVTTNISRFPTSREKAKELIAKLGKPKINLSIDREHLRFGRQMPERIRAACAAAKELSSRILIINVAQNKYQQKHPWPKDVVNAIPRELKKRAEIRLEQYSKLQLHELYSYLKAAAAGKKAHFPITLEFPVPLFDEISFPARIGFAPGGRAYMSNTPDALHFPQLSLGNWQREPMHSIIETNLPFKRNLLKEWLGYIRLSGKMIAPGIYGIDRPNPKKKQLFAQYALRRFRAQRKKRRGF